MFKTKEKREGKPLDVLKNFTKNFIEHEIKNNDFENVGINQSQSQYKTHANGLGTETKYKQDDFTITNESIKAGSYAPQRYKTTCYFQPKNYPVKYSETVIVNIGSTKKRYFECAYYMTKMVPHRWTESMATLTPAAVCKSEINIPFKEDYHYISLEAQQPKMIEAIS